jgi:hypothetical protein
MYSALTVVAIGVGVLLVGWLYMRLWRWRCPACGRRQLRFAGTASEWSSEWVESRFWEARCGGCGRYAVQRSGLFGRWEPARHAEPGAAPDPARDIGSGSS